jgi:hypothetical protein
MNKLLNLKFVPVVSDEEQALRAKLAQERAIQGAQSAFRMQVRNLSHEVRRTRQFLEKPSDSVCCETFCSAMGAEEKEQFAKFKEALDALAAVFNA